MHLSYGDVEMKMLFVRNIARQPEFSTDGVDYLWTHWVIDCVCVYNPTQMAYDPGPAAVPAGARRLAIDTDAALWNYLSQPRRRLLITTEGGNIYLRSPKAGYTVDHNNGPKITMQSVEEIHGEKTFVVHLQIETWLHDCDEEHILLSHRWRRFSDTDHDFLTTITTEGECVFNAAELTRLGQHADQFRMHLFHPVPNHFQRERVQVFPASEGHRYMYRTIDRERSGDLGANSPAIRVEFYKTGGFTKKGMGVAAREFATSLPELIGSFFGFQGQMAQGQAAGRTGVNLFNQAHDTFMPMMYASVDIRAWGKPRTSRRDLRNVAYSIMATHLAPFPLGAATQEFIVTEDQINNCVHVSKTVRWSLADDAPFLTRFLDITDERGVPDPIEHRFQFTDGQGLSPDLGGNDNPQPQYGAFGKTLIEMMTAALSEPCALPDTPPTTKGQVFNPKTIT